MITVRCKGDFKKLNSFLEKGANLVNLGTLDKYGREGVRALQASTPELSGRAKQSWGYRIIRKKGGVSLEWFNDDIEGGYNVIILLQYGHATKNGYFLEGRDIINPTMRPIFDKIAKDAWEEVLRT